MRGPILIILLINFVSKECDGKIYDVILEKLELVTFDRSYIKELKLEEHLNKRGEAESVSLNITLSSPWGRNVSMKYDTYGLINHKYKKSFGDMEANLCDSLENDHIVWPILQRYIILPHKCPIPAGQYQMRNFKMGPVVKVRYAPFEKGVVMFKFLKINLNSKKNILVVQVKLSNILNKN